MTICLMTIWSYDGIEWRDLRPIPEVNFFLQCLWSHDQISGIGSLSVLATIGALQSHHLSPLPIYALLAPWHPVFHHHSWPLPSFCSYRWWGVPNLTLWTKKSLYTTLLGLARALFPITLLFRGECCPIGFKISLLISILHLISILANLNCPLFDKKNIDNLNYQ